MNIRDFKMSGQWFYLAVVMVPTVLSGIYLTLIATPGYVSRAQVIVERDPQFSAPSFAIGGLSLGNEPSRLDALVIESFMQSRTMLEYLDDQLDLRGHFSRDGIDPLTKLRTDASREDFLEYFRDHLTTLVDDESYIVELEFVAHDPEFTQQVVVALVRRSEEFVNEISRQLAREQLTFVQTEVQRAQDELKSASRALIDLQRTYEVFSPERETEAVGEIIIGLLQELAKQRTELKALQSYLNSNAPEVIGTKKRISALEKQVEQERGKQVGTGQNGLNDLMLAYQDAQLGVTLATEIYKTGLTTLETTRLEASRKVKHLVSVSTPSLPDDAERPRSLYWTLTIFVFLNIGYFVLSLVTATIRDHKD